MANPGGGPGRTSLPGVPRAGGLNPEVTPSGVRIIRSQGSTPSRVTSSSKPTLTPSEQKARDVMVSVDAKLARVKANMTSECDLVLHGAEVSHYAVLFNFSHLHTRALFLHLDPTALLESLKELLELEVGSVDIVFYLPRFFADVTTAVSIIRYILSTLHSRCMSRR